MSDKTGDLMNKLTSTDSPEELEKYLEEIRNKYPGNLSSYIKSMLDGKGLSVADVQKKSGITK